MSVAAHCTCNGCGIETDNPVGWFALRLNSWFVALQPGAEEGGLTTHHACGEGCLHKLLSQWAEKREAVREAV